MIVWDVASGAERHRLRDHEGAVLSCAISADGGTGLSGSDDGTVIVWDVASGAERHRLRSHEGRVLGCAISTDGGTGLSGSDDGTVIVWDVASGHVICRWALAWVTDAVALSPARTVLVGDRKGDVTCLEIIFP